VIGAARSLTMMGEEVLPGLYEREIDYLCGYEWALTARDILWRRSKLKLHLNHNAESVLDTWLADYQHTLGGESEPALSQHVG